MTHTQRTCCFDDTAMAYQRQYLQCVVSKDWIFQRGHPEIVSRMPASHYQLLLMKPGEVPSGMTGRDYQNALDKTQPTDQLALTNLLQTIPKNVLAYVGAITIRMSMVMMVFCLLLVHLLSLLLLQTAVLTAMGPALAGPLLPRHPRRLLWTEMTVSLIGLKRLKM